MDRYTLRLIAFAGILGTGPFLLCAFLMKLTNGLFLSRLPHQFVQDRHDPQYEHERQAGQRFSKLAFKYLPPFFIGFLLILLLSYFDI